MSFRPTYLARQAILDARSEIHGYELLFRDDAQHPFGDHIAGDKASAQVINQTLFVHGLDDVANRKKAFINVTEHLLKEGYSDLLPPDRVVLELSADIPANPDTLEACRRHRLVGFQLALHSSDLDGPQSLFFEFARVVKVDFRKVPREERPERLRRLRAGGDFQLVAEKIETSKEYSEARRSSYDLFQGYYLAKPEIVTGREPIASRETFVQFLEAVGRPNLDFARISEIITQDANLSVRLLRYINSFATGLRKEVESVRHALVLLGQRRLGKWVALTALEGLSHGQPSELMTSSLIRAHCCERLAESISEQDRSFDYFLAGLLSRADLLLNTTLPEALEEMKVPQSVSEALIMGKDSNLTTALALVVAYESGDVERVADLSQRLGIPADRVAEIYKAGEKRLSETAESFASFSDPPPLLPHR